MQFSPVSPSEMDWSTYYPAFVVQSLPLQEDESSTPPEAAISSIPKLVQEVEVADIGCGFGGLLVALAPLLPDKLLLGSIYQPWISYIN